MGARPVALLDGLRFGASGVDFERAVEGIAHYGRICKILRVLTFVDDPAYRRDDRRGANGPRRLQCGDCTRRYADATIFRGFTCGRKRAFGRLSGECASLLHSIFD
jgi:hypothetical protein